MPDSILHRQPTKSAIEELIDPETVLRAQRQCARRYLSGVLSMDELRVVLDALGIRRHVS